MGGGYTEGWEGRAGSERKRRGRKWDKRGGDETGRGGRDGRDRTGWDGVREDRMGKDVECVCVLDLRRCFYFWCSRLRHFRGFPHHFRDWEILMNELKQILQGMRRTGWTRCVGISGASWA